MLIHGFGETQLFSWKHGMSNSELLLTIADSLLYTSPVAVNRLGTRRSQWGKATEHKHACSQSALALTAAFPHGGKYFYFTNEETEAWRLIKEPAQNCIDSK